MGRQAVTEGLADDLGTFEEVLREAQSRARQAQGAARNRSDASMSVLGNDDQNRQTTQAPAPGPQATHTQAQVDAAVADARAAGAAEANARWGAIMGHADVAGREKAAFALASANPTMSADAVASFVKEHVAVASTTAPVTTTVAPAGPKTIAERAADAHAAVSGAPLGTDPARPDGGTSTEETQAKAGWDAARKEQQAAFERSQRSAQRGR